MADKLSFFEKGRRYDQVAKERDDALALITVHENTIKALEASAGKPAELEAAVTEASGKIVSLEAALKEQKDLNATMAEGLKKAAGEKAAAEKSTDEKASRLAAQQLAEVGVAPVAAAAGLKPGGESLVMSRASFNQLTPSARMKFIKSGGKLTE